MAQSASMLKSQYETLAAFRYALRQYLHFSEQEVATAGLTAQQYQAMLAIKGFPGRDQVTVGELAERMLLRHHSTVGLVDRLAAERLVARAPSDTDRRQVNVKLTRRGENVLAKLSSAHKAQLRRISPELSGLLQRLTGVD